MDNHYFSTVNTHGGEFILLVCESCFVWSSFALSTLFTIAESTNVKMLCLES